MRVVTWNVNGIRARFDQVVAFADTHRPDIIGLQEIKAAPTQIPESLFGLAEYRSYWHGDFGGYSGVSLHVHRDLGEPTFAHPAFDMENRIVEATVGDIVVASVYVPNGRRSYEDKITFLGALREYAAGVLGRGQALIVMGDLNVARTDRDVHPKLRKRGTIGQRADERQLLEAVIDAGLVDVGRALAPDDDELFTWWPPWREEKVKNRGWRLDYVLVPPSLYERVTESVVHRDYGTSDHVPVAVDMADRRAPGA